MGASGLHPDYTVRVVTGKMERPPVGNIDKKSCKSLVFLVPCEWWLWRPGRRWAGSESLD